MTGHVDPLGSAADEVICRVDDRYPRVRLLVQPEIMLLVALAPHPRDLQFDGSQALAECPFQLAQHAGWRDGDELGRRAAYLQDCPALDQPAQRLVHLWLRYERVLRDGISRH